MAGLRVTLKAPVTEEVVPGEFSVEATISNEGPEPATLNLTQASYPSLVLEVENISFKQYVALKKAISTVKEVKDVSATFSNNIAKCSIQSDVRAEVLAEKLVETIENLEINDVSQNVIKAKLTD